MNHISSPSIILSNSTLYYRGHQLFDKLSLEMVGGRWSCLLGPSGVGKTSLLRLIAGLHSSAVAPTPATDEHNKTLDGRVSYLSQHPSLFPWLSVIDNVLVGERLRGNKISKTTRKKARALLHHVGLGEHQLKKPHELSGGMKQRAILARTAFEDRTVVLLDEPFSALDAITRLKMQELACEVFKNKTVVLVTHDPLEALRLGDDVFVMAGCPAVLSEPIHPAGTAPRDLMDATLLSMQGELLKKLEDAMVDE